MIGEYEDVDGQNIEACSAACVHLRFYDEYVYNIKNNYYNLEDYNSDESDEDDNDFVRSLY